MPNRISVSPDGLFALTMPAETDGSYEALPQSGHIWLVDSRTGRVQTALTEGENLSWATFSPDGNELLYVESPSVDPTQILTGKLSHPWHMMLFDRQSNAQTEVLAGDRGFLWGPSFSPDGRTIAYYRGDGEGRLGLYLFDRDAHQERLLKLVQDGAGLYYAPYGPGPLWTMDGQGVFVFRVEQILPQETLPNPDEITPETVRIFAGRLAIVSVDCSCEQHVLRGYFPLLPVPLFLIASPDGQKLYLNGYDRTFSVSPTERVNLYEIAVETGEQTTLYDHGGIVVAPALSPDGERMLFTVITPDKPLTADLYLLDLTSARPARKLTDDGRSGFGFWLSYEEIGFLRVREREALRGELWVKNLSTNTERDLSMLLAAQSSIPKLIREMRTYQEQITTTEQSLKNLEHRLQGLSDAVVALSQRLDAAQTHSAELSDQTNQRLSELAQQIGALLADVSAVKSQLSGIETEVKAVNARPTLSLWQVIITLLIAVIVIVWLIRRALHGLAQQIAFPPQ
uniref:WD40 repeat protein n=2 Tax=Candidatus Bipolaricaulota TaxID=67810 RepID=H5SMN6_9BACT|nr:hypothetical protein HGMM_F50D11C31 [uncultured Acetothermia bacterium]BAL59804.1 hypothetical protein HGMM_OP4C440 [Candidatus Acetothermum autotrophicum]